MNWTRSRAVLLSGLLPIQFACAETARPSADLSITDSANVVVVDVGPLHTVSAPALSLDLVFRTSVTGVELFGVVAARLLEDGRVAVGNAGNREVLLLEASGALERIVGRGGEGPGEFGTISTLHRAQGGGFNVYDTRIGRWTHYDRNGDMVSTEPMSPPSRSTDLTPLALGAEGHLLAIYGALRRFPGEGIQRDTTPLLLYAAKNASPDTLSRWATRETSFERWETGWGPTPVGFGRSLASFGTDQWAVLGDTDRLDVSLFVATGRLVMRIRGGGDPIKTDEADGEQWRRALVASLGPDMPEEFRASFGRAPWRESYPAFDKLAVDAVGRIWIGTTAMFGDEQRRWLIFGPDGRPSGALALPVDTDILDITRTHLLTLERDELNVEELVLWEIHGLE